MCDIPDEAQHQVGTTKSSGYGSNRIEYELEEEEIFHHKNAAHSYDDYVEPTYRRNSAHKDRISEYAPHQDYNSHGIPEAGGHHDDDELVSSHSSSKFKG